MKKVTLSLIFFTLLMCSTSFAQKKSSIWTPIKKHELAERSILSQEEMPKQFQAYQISNTKALEQLLQSAPLRFSPEASENKVNITLPMPDGRMEIFRIFDFPVLQPKLANAYPQIKTFTAAGLSNPNATAKIQMTPRGFSAMILGYEQGTIFINPFNVAEKTYYAYYQKHSRNENHQFSCQVEASLDDEDQITGMEGGTRVGDCQLHQYRLALACNGEYAQFHDDGDDSNGDIVADALATMVVAIDQINGIFEREVGVTLVIIDENEEIIFTDPDTDPYTNSSTLEMSNENVTTLNSIIGSQNFEIGHVFGIGNSGRANVKSPCTSNRARGVSRGGAINDRFISLIAHEIGHQFGAFHTQNNPNCFPSFSAPYEPGSGSTIVSYGGICFPNVQNYRDAYFHAISLEQIAGYLTGPINSCSVILNAANNPPSADAGKNYLIPVSTPFVLTGSGVDPDDDPITYCWEQWDKEPASIPPVSTDVEGPSFRSVLPSADPERYFPRLSALVGLDVLTWEVLPSVSRDLNFRLTVRDNHSAYGCTGEDNMTVTTDATAGPFRVTYPNLFEEWTVGDSEIITWDVANTDAAPISCANVDIFYSTDGGLTFPNVLATKVPNNGNYQITVPDIASSQVRIMVRCSDNIFFDISNTNTVVGVQYTCVELTSDDIPIEITTAGTPTITSEIDIDFEQTISRIRIVDLNGTHSYIGELRFKLISPEGIECLLIDQECLLFDDFDVTIDDFGALLTCPFNNGQTVKPEEPLSVFLGTNTAGTWTLEIADLEGFEGGELLGWGLEICYEESLPTAVDDISSLASLKLSPNPANQQLNVDLSFKGTFNGVLQLINTYGQILELIAIEGAGHLQHQLPLDDLPSGVYFVRVLDDKDRQMVERFIKQ